MKYRGFPLEIKKSSARAKIYRVRHEKSKGGFLFTTVTERLAISFLLFEKICDQSYLEVRRLFP